MLEKGRVKDIKCCTVYRAKNNYKVKKEQEIIKIEEEKIKFC